MPGNLSTAQRAIDRAAVAAVLRRAGRAGSAPWLHAEVARRMVERLAVFKLRPQRIVEWWGCTGASGALLEADCPQAQRVIIEPTEALARRSRTALARPWWSAQRWRAAPAAVQLEGSELSCNAQLVWANMMLHAESDPPALMAHWHHLLETDGVVMFSCLGPGSLVELTRLYARLGWPPPSAAFVDMHDLGDMLVRAGFSEPVLDQETLSLHWASPQALLDELRSMGANAAPNRYAGLRTPRWRERLLVELRGLAGLDGRIHLSFEVAYGHAFKAAPRPSADEPTRVSLHDMREMVRSHNAVTRRRDNAERG